MQSFLSPFESLKHWNVLLFSNQETALGGWYIAWSQKSKVGSLPYSSWFIIIFRSR